MEGAGFTFTEKIVESPVHPLAVALTLYETDCCEEELLKIFVFVYMVDAVVVVDGL